MSLRIRAHLRESATALATADESVALALAAKRRPPQPVYVKEPLQNWVRSSPMWVRFVSKLGSFFVSKCKEIRHPICVTHYKSAPCKNHTPQFSGFVSYFSYFFPTPFPPQRGNPRPPGNPQTRTGNCEPIPYVKEQRGISIVKRFDCQVAISCEYTAPAGSPRRAVGRVPPRGGSSAPIAVGRGRLWRRPARLPLDRFSVVQASLLVVVACSAFPTRRGSKGGCLRSPSRRLLSRAGGSAGRKTRWKR